VDVEYASVVSSAGEVDGLGSGEEVRGVGVWRDEPMGPAPGVELVEADPEHLGVPVVGVDDVAGDFEYLVGADGLADPLAFFGGSAVGPDDAWAEGFEALVDGDSAAAVEAADAGSGDVLGVDLGLAYGLSDGLVGGLGPDLGPLFCPAWVGVEDGVFAVGCGVDFAVVICEGGFCPVVPMSVPMR